MSSQTPTLVGVTVAVLIIAAVATIGYYQVAVAPNLTSTTSTGPPPVVCPGPHCVNVTIPSGAGSTPSGFKPGDKTTFGFSPDVVTIVIGKNNTVYWTNSDGSIHTATSDPGASPPFDTGNIATGGSAQWTFTVPGTYTYHCTYHSWMQGTIKVLAGSASSSTTTSTKST